MITLFTLIFMLAEGVEPLGTPFWVPAVIVVLMVLLLWWGLTRNAIPTGTAVPDSHGHADHDHEQPQASHQALAAAPETASAAPETASAAPETASAVPEPASTIPDDLQKIEGIGPKIEQILHAAGIQTFAQLAAAEVAHLEQIVRKDAGIRIAFPETWPEQARLAHAGNWTALGALQDELKGGRRSV